MQQLNLTLKIITPMFISGANPKGAALRAPSLVGALRFWWQALAWSRLTSGQEPHNDADARKLLQYWEAQTFGSTAGQSPFRIRLSHPDRLKHTQVTAQNTPVNRSAERGGTTLAGYSMYTSNGASVFHRSAAGNYATSGSGLIYMAGLGLAGFVRERENSQQQTSIGKFRDLRPALLHNQTFMVNLIAPKLEALLLSPQTDTGAPGLLDAFEALCLFGGLGSRSRRGFGSIQLDAWSWQPQLSQASGSQCAIETRLNTLKALKVEDIEAFFKKYSRGAHPEYSAFSQSSRLALLTRPPDIPITQTNTVSDFSQLAALVPSQGDPIADTHNRLGQSFVWHRGKGFRGRHSGVHKVGGLNSLGTYSQDSTWFDDINQAQSTASQSERKKILTNENVANTPPPCRVGFGLPLQFSSRSTGSLFSVILNATDTDNNAKRRASPLLFSIKRLENNQILIVILNLHARFLPEAYQIGVSAKDMTSVALRLPSTDENPAQDYLNFLQTPPNNVRSELHDKIFEGYTIKVCAPESPQPVSEPQP
ncbi:type III-B CRISPR module RAMP protein Cmr1 [Woodsholea maritima]|uniref:type III-B CRISPR module RAMP protein Cmr1 n=1 Tax=Woodsholea maritima TaxID=240237 RepID=UPI0003608543|nr:type III-B CRISPR module RAMP protein Cmr1 [Woodsholea maritima]